MTTIVTIDMGGTGATHAAGAREALSVPSITDMGQSYAQANAAYAQANTARSDANTTFATVNTTFGTVNTNYQAAYAQANTARDTGNNAYSSANLTYAQANNARSDANTTFATVNTTFGTVNTSLGTINTNYQAAYAQANNARSDANTTFATVNTTFGTINTNYQAAYAQANTARGTANDAYAAANTKLSTSGGSISGDLSITGNLTVQGNATTINVSNLSVNDSIILLAAGGTGDSLDIGFVGHIQRGATDTHAGLIRKATQNQFYLFDNYEVEPTNNVIDVSGNNFRVGNLRLGIINANSYVTSAGLDVTGQANAAYSQANTARSDANTTFATINTTFATLNTSAATQNTNIGNAYDQANTARGQANTAYNQANTARSDANTTFATINTTFGTTNTTFATINSTFATLNTADSNRVLKAGDTMTGQLNVSSGGLIINGYVGGTVGSPIASFNKTVVIGANNYNQPYNTANSVLLLISDYSNDGTDNVFPIWVEDENNLVDFYLNSGTNGSNSTKTAYFAGNIGVGATPAFTSGSGIEIQRATATATLRLDSSSFATELYGYTDGTGLYQLSAGYLDLGTNNTRRLRITSDGNVGIGVTNPFSKLQVGAHTFSGANGVYADDRAGISVHGSLTSIMYASTYNSATYPDYGLVFIHGANTSNYNVWSLSPDGPAKGNSLNFIYGANATNIHTTTPKVVFRGDGSVGIGTVSPSTRLHVYGGDGITVDSSGAADNNYLTCKEAGTTRFSIYENSDVAYINSHNSMHFRANQTGGSGGLFYFNGGNVMVGTATSYFNERLAVNGITRIVDLHVAGGIGNGNYARFYHDDANLTISMTRTSGAGHIIMSPFGNVAIGTTSTDARLHVGSGGMVIESGAPTGRSSYGIGTLNLILKANTASGSGISGIDFRSGGNYPSDGAQIYYMSDASGASGAESSRLWIRVENDAADDIYLRAGSINYDADTVDGGPANPSHIFKVDGSNVMIINTSGNVGIATGSPAEKLHVVGNIVATGSITASYSDARFKDIISRINNPLQIISNIDAIFYRPNELVKSKYPEQEDRVFVGVTAQSVKEVLPEVVVPSPIDPEYDTVHYERLVPVLIAAIQEQQKQIEELKAKLN